MSDLPGDPENTALIQAIICMAKSLDLKVVGEGIENAEQLTFLTKLGVNIGQGYFLGRPMPPEEFREFSLAGKVTH